ncbi:MAG: alkyl hydroperoxide reductase subunit F [Betaproteobacteria bacterium]|jgi:alkyl hydroperoxide reductase subunit F|nr:alkyl hydroperoxide reductase subunit F [Betaproteobacteria bacterium]
MLDDNIKAQLQAYLEKVVQPIELVASLDDGEVSHEIRELIREIAALSDKVSAREDGRFERRPSFGVARVGEAPRIHFAGLPMGHEFTSLILALLQTGGHPPKAEPETLAQIHALEGEFRFETFVSLSCHNCPDVVQALNLMAVMNPGVSHVMIDGALFQDEVEKRQVMAVPNVFLNGQPFDQGRMELAGILAKIDPGASSRGAEAISAKEPFDVLVIGGGPAGSAAAIYAARKGIRTGIVAERFGGQVLDTLAIENLISVKETEGPKLAAALEEHVRHYDVDVMSQQTAVALVPPPKPGALAEVRLESGAVLKARSVILATGARWREMGVPGEKKFRAKGVAFCPHCDGPLFKGKRVAVIGGGNSGVEAAIDLAGIVSHVTLLEFAPELRADAVLQSKLASLPNVTTVRNAQTVEVTGTDRVDGLVYQNRVTGETSKLDLEGIFVQIGLMPNTAFLGNMLNVTRIGEIEVDPRGQTSAHGIFAAGDCTTVPYKQIIIAMGEGAKASLSAFDYLIRTSVPAGERSMIP